MLEHVGSAAQREDAIGGSSAMQQTNGYHYRTRSLTGKDHSAGSNRKMTKNSFGARTALEVGGKTFTIYALAALTKRGFNLERLPFSIKVLLENVLRRED